MNNHITSVLDKIAGMKATLTDSETLHAISVIEKWLISQEIQDDAFSAGYLAAIEGDVRKSCPFADQLSASWNDGKESAIEARKMFMECDEWPLN